MPRISFLSPLPNWRRTNSSRRRHFFSSVSWASWAFQYIAVEHALLVEQGGRGRAEAVRAVVVARTSIAARSALFSVLSDIGTPSPLAVQQIANQRRDQRLRRRSRAKGNRVGPKVVQHEISVSLGIVGHNGGYA